MFSSCSSRLLLLSPSKPVTEDEVLLIIETKLHIQTRNKTLMNYIVQTQDSYTRKGSNSCLKRAHRRRQNDSDKKKEGNTKTKWFRYKKRRQLISKASTNKGKTSYANKKQDTDELHSSSPRFRYKKRRQFMSKASTDNSEKTINKIREIHQHKQANKTHLKENTKPIIHFLLMILNPSFIFF